MRFWCGGGQIPLPLSSWLRFSRGMESRLCVARRVSAYGGLWRLLPPLARVPFSCPPSRMNVAVSETSRPWQDIIAEAAKETDHKKLNELGEELARALA